MAEDFTIMVTKRDSKCRWLLDIGIPDDFAIANQRLPITHASDTDSSTGSCDRYLYYEITAHSRERSSHIIPSLHYKFGDTNRLTANLDTGTIANIGYVFMSIWLSTDDVSVTPGQTTWPTLADENAGVATFQVHFFPDPIGHTAGASFDHVRVNRINWPHVADYNIAIFQGDETEAVHLRVDPVSRVSVDDVQVWLNDTMLELDRGDTLPESVEVEGVLLGRLRSRFDVSAWRDSETTPPVIKALIAKLIAARRYRTLFASRDGELPRYSFDLEEEVWGRGRDGGALGDILNGSIDLMDNEGNIIAPLRGATTVSGYTEGKPQFTIGMEF